MFSKSCNTAFDSKVLQKDTCYLSLSNVIKQKRKRRVKNQFERWYCYPGFLNLFKLTICFIPVANGLQHNCEDKLWLTSSHFKGLFLTMPEQSETRMIRCIFFMGSQVMKLYYYERGRWPWRGKKWLKPWCHSQNLGYSALLPCPGFLGAMGPHLTKQGKTIFGQTCQTPQEGFNLDLLGKGVCPSQSSQSNINTFNGCPSSTSPIAPTSPIKENHIQYFWKC